VDNAFPDGPTSHREFIAQAARRPGLLVYAMAGLQAGIVGVLWMFGCFVVAAFWSGGGIWSVPNLFSTVFYGDFAYQDYFLRSTWAGMALIVVIYGLLGAVWGCFWKSERKPLLAFFGALTGVAVYYLCFDFVWQYVDQLIPLYAPTRELQVAHILWGVALAKSPGYARRIALAESGTPPAGPPESASPPPVLHSDNQPSGDDAESVSGELIL